MNPLSYLTGLLMVGVVAGAFWLTAGTLCGRLAPAWTGALAILARIVLALSVAVVTSELLGLAGLLTAPALAAAAILIAILVRRWRPEHARVATAPSPPAPRLPTLALIMAVVAAVVTAIHWAGPVLQSLDVGIYRQDSDWYHLPLAAWFAQTGSVGGLLLTDPLKLAVWYYPLNSEVLHAIGMVLLGNDLLSPLLNFGWMGLALLAAWCIGRPVGLAVATLLAAVLVVDSDMMLIQAGNAPSDIVALTCLLATIAVLANGWAARGVTSHRSASGVLQIDSGPLVIAALAAGLAIGAKVTMLAPVSVITIAVVWTGGGGRRRRALIWLGGLLSTGGFWYLRNLAHSGNPLPWIRVGPLPGPNQEALYPRPAHSIAQYIADRHAWTDFFLPGFSETLGPAWFVVLFAAISGIVLGLRRSNSRPIRLLALAGGVTLVLHVFNPISASGPDGGPYGFASNLRYAAPGIAIGLILLPLCESRWMSRRVLIPAYALLVCIGAATSAEWIQPDLVAAIAIGATAVLVPLWLIRGGASGRRRLLVLAAVVVVAVIAGYPQQRRYFDDRYRTDVAPPLDNPGFRATGQWRRIQTWAREQHGLRIGIVGTPAAYGQYVLYGDDLSNEVRYLGEPQPDGGLTPIKGCRRWRELIDGGRFDVVLITPEDPGSPVLPPQIGWTILGGTAKPLLNVLPAGLFVLTGPLDPGLCAKERAPQLFTSPGGLRNPHLLPGGGGPPSLPLAPAGTEAAVPTR